jgi:hypothetical protein
VYDDLKSNDCDQTSGPVGHYRFFVTVQVVRRAVFKNPEESDVRLGFGLNNLAV